MVIIGKMKKEVSPKIMAAVIVVVVGAIGFFLFHKAANNDPTPRPDAKYFTGSSTPTPGAAPAATK